jgi:hypothetical protein
MTTKRIIPLTGLLWCCLFSFEAKGQSVPQETRDSIFMSALRDELSRSMSNLVDTGSGKPCFISYSLLNGVLTNSEAVLGALTGSSSIDAGDWYLRLMMGSYERNDENFIDPLAGPDVQNQIEMVCPVEPDYWSIRKAFWWNTDNVFRSAAKSYKNKINAIREFPLDAETSTLPDYTRAPTVRLSYPGSIISFPRKQTDDLVKELSAVFRDVKGIHKSEASLTALSSTVYTVNSEGSEIRIPLNICLVNITVQVKTEDEEILSDNLSYLAPLVSSLPPLDTMKQASLRLGEYLLLLKNAPASGEEYYGPVLLFQQALSNAFLSALFSPDNSLIASREPLVYNMKKSMVPRERKAFETRLDKRILSKELSVTAMPRLEQYNAITLMGSTKVDAEGIIPPEEIILVQNGILKNLLSDRVPTPKVPRSNGHHRTGVRMGGFTFQNAPSVIKISTALPYSHPDLKQKLISLAREKGLEYAYILKPLIASACYSPLCYYRIGLQTGEEKLVRPLLLNPVSLNDLNKSLFMSDNVFVCNFLYGSLSRFGSTVMDGIPVSMIIPDAMVMEEVTLNVSSGNSGYDMPVLE